MLGYIPGLLHAWYIIAKFPEPDFEYTRIGDSERGSGNGRVTYVIVQGPNGNPARVPKSQVGRGGYGTTAPMAPPVTQGQDGTWGNGSGNGNAAASGSGSASASAPVHVDAGEGSSEGVPPSYAEAVKGDHKIQTSD